MAQAERDEFDDAACDSFKDELIEKLSRLEIKGGKAADNLLSAKSALERGACSKNLFAVTVYLRAADSVN